MATPETTPHSGQDDFIRLYAQAYPAVYGFILSLLPGASDAEDLVQQTSLVLWRKFDQFVAGGNFTAWACQIAKFEVLNHLRTKSRDRHVFSPEMIELLATEHTEEIELLESQRLALEECLGKLPSRDRRLLHQCYADGVKLKEVAERVGRTPNSLYKWLNRVRESLLQCVSLRLGEV